MSAWPDINSNANNDSETLKGRCVIHQRPLCGFHIEFGHVRHHRGQPGKYGAHLVIDLVETVTLYPRHFTITLPIERWQDVRVSVCHL